MADEKKDIGAGGGGGGGNEDARPERGGGSSGGDTSDPKGAGDGAAAGGSDTGGSDTGGESGGKDKGGSSGTDTGGSDTGKGGGKTDTGGTADDQGQGGQPGQGKGGKGQQDLSDADPTKNKLAKNDTGGSADDQQDKQKKKGNMSQRMKQAAMKAQAAAQAAMMAMKALMVMNLIAFFQALLQAVVAAVAAAVQAIVAVVMAVVQAVAVAIGVSVAVAAFGIVGLLIVGAVVIVAAVVTASSEAETQQRDAMPDCVVDTSYMEQDTTLDARKVRTARIIYAYFKALKYSDAQIAGILGNWESESQLDSYAVETVYSFTGGLNAFEMWWWKGEVQVTWNYSNGVHVSTTYEQVGNLAYYQDPIGYNETTGEMDYERRIATVTSGERGFSISPGTYQLKFNVDMMWPFPRTTACTAATHLCGIGLGQWTNGRNQLLMDYAEAHGRDWYGLDLQLIFSLSGDDSTRVNWLLNSWVDDQHQLYADTENGAREAASRFCTVWEGISPSDIRLTRAENWFKVIHSWSAGRDYSSMAGTSLWDIVRAESGIASDSSQSTALRACSGAKFQDNSTLAAAIISYCWGPGQSASNDGTKCWKHLWSSLMPGDEYPRSCDRTVAVAVHWSGTDSNFPYGACYHIMEYLIPNAENYKRQIEAGSHGYLSPNQAHWMLVEMPAFTGDGAEWFAALQPGDILLRSDDYELGTPGAGNGVGHILMYVGIDQVRRRWPDAADSYIFAAGSLNTLSPHVHGFYGGSSGLQTYKVFRCMKTYSNAPAETYLTCVDHDNDT